MKTTIVTLILTILVENSLQRSTLDSESYVAAVVEFSPNEPESAGKSPSEINAARYVSFIEQATKQNVDIIVFPEVGLTSIHEPGRNGLEAWATLVPSPGENYMPCVNSMIPVSKPLEIISCAARNNTIYVVVNLIEKVICTNETCPTDKRLYYNTNVVFDREGKIIARYRKTNLFNERAFNVTTTPEVITFETDFGVTFGTFICFDILFKKPAMYLTRILNITDIVYPTAWFSELPFLTALQTQAGWAYAEDVNLLASGYNRPAFGNTGSGIYLGRRGVAKATILKSTRSEMVVSTVPKIKRDSSRRWRPRYDSVDEVVVDEEEHVHDELRKRRSVVETESSTIKIDEDREKKMENLALLHEDLSLYKTRLFNDTISSRLCDDEFCCDFKVTLRNNDGENYYRMLVYDGTRTFLEPVTVGLRVCAIVTCANDTLTSCGSSSRTTTRFDDLDITMTLPIDEDIVLMPSSVDNDLRPLANWGYVENWDQKEIRIIAKLSSPTSNFLTCGIYGRDFSRDKKNDGNAWPIGMQWATLTALAIVSIFLVFLYRKGWRKPWHRENQLTSDFGPYRHLRTR